MGNQQAREREEREEREKEREERKREQERAQWPEWAKYKEQHLLQRKFDNPRLIPFEQMHNLQHKQEIKIRIFNEIKSEIEERQRKYREQEQEHEREREQWPEWAKDKEQQIYREQEQEQWWQDEYEKKARIFNRIKNEIQTLQRKQEEQEREEERKQWPLWAKNMEKELLEQQPKISQTTTYEDLYKQRQKIFDKVKTKIQEREEEKKEQQEEIKKAVRAIVAEMNLGGARNNVEPSAPPLFEQSEKETTEEKMETITEIVSSQLETLIQTDPSAPPALPEIVYPQADIIEPIAEALALPIEAEAVEAVRTSLTLSREPQFPSIPDSRIDWHSLSLNPNILPEINLLSATGPNRLWASTPENINRERTMALMLNRNRLN